MFSLVNPKVEEVDKQTEKHSTSRDCFIIMILMTCSDLIGLYFRLQLGMTPEAKGVGRNFETEISYISL